MSRKWNLALLVLLASLIFAGVGVATADNMADNVKIPSLAPQIQLELERLDWKLTEQITENKKNLEQYEEKLEIKTEAIEKAYDKIIDRQFKLSDDKYEDFKWTFGIMFTLLGFAVAGGGGYLLNKWTISRIDSEIRSKIDEVNKTIEVHKKEINKLKQEVERDFQQKLEEMKNIRPDQMTPEEKETVKKTAKEIERKPKEEYSAWKYFVQGLQAASDGEIKNEINCYKKAIKQNPDFPEPYYNLGWIYSNAGEQDQATEIFKKGIEALKKAIMLNLNEAKNYFKLGTSYIRIGEFKKAIEALEETLRLDPGLLKADYNLACAYSRSKDKDNAFKYLELAINKGFNRLKHLEEDSALDFIRNTPEYKRIIKKLKDKLQ